MLFDREVNISIGSGLVFGPPGLSIFLGLPDICKWFPAGHVVHNVFQFLHKNYGQKQYSLPGH